MKLSRDNPEFNNYDIFVIVEVRKPRIILSIPVSTSVETQEVKLTNVVEADDESGFLVQNETDDKGNLLYTNGHDEIAIDNTVKFLMCNPQLRQGFLAAGFRPKLTSRYEKTLRIVRRVGVLEKRSEAREEVGFPNDRVQFDAI